MIDMFLCCIRILKRKGKRTFFTCLSIAVGVCSVILISSLGNTGISLIQSEIAQLGLDGVIISCNEAVTNTRLDKELCRAVENMESVASAAGLSLETGRIRMHGLVSTAVVWGVSENYDKVMKIPLVYGRYIDRNELESGAKVCLLDLESAKEFYRRGNIVGKKLSFDYNGQRDDFEIVGIVEAGGSGLQNLMGEYIPSFLYLPYHTLQQISGKSGFSQISVLMEENVQPNSINSIENRVKAISGKYGAVTVDDLSGQNKSLSNMLKKVSLSLSMIAAVSLVVAAIGTMTNMMISVKERTREIGIKKSIGSTKKRIMIEYLIESVVISSIGALMGSITALLTIKLISFVFPVELNGIGLSCLVCVVLGSVFGVIPAKQAACLDPIQALRSE